MSLTPGTRVGPYEVAALLGSGGMADVYRARDTRLGRDVAIKVISEALAAEGPFRERFEREARVAASLSHPNVVALYDVGFQEGQPYLVTELLRGETLRARLEKGPVPVHIALEWAAQMAQGLAAAHEHGIVHRDLKPDNVFITSDGHVKLLDFGIAKLAETARESHGLMEQTAAHSAWNTGKGIVVGTPGYMSPEQGRGDQVDARTDFFNFGAVVYEMLCGRPAFPAGPAVERGYAILHSEPESLPSGVPPQVAQVVRRCLEKVPARRYQSARDLAFHLELLRTPTASSLRVSNGAADRPRWRRWVWTPAAVLAALGVAAATYFAGRGSRLPPPSVEQVTFRRGAVSASRFTPDGRVAFSAAWGAEPEEIFTRAPGSPDAQSLGVAHSRLLGISPNGEFAVALRPLWYGLSSWGGTLALVPPAGGAPREVGEGIQYADYSPSGELAVIRYTRGQRQLEYPLGTPLLVSTGWLAFPRVSPTGDTVAFFRGGPDSGELMLVDRKGTTRRLIRGYSSGLAWTPSGQEVWFSAGSGIWAVPLTGDPRLVYQGLSDMQLEDISRDGRAIVNTEKIRSEMAFVAPGHQHETELAFLDFSSLEALSADGQQVLFTAELNGEMETYIRGTDGSPPVKLGRGAALAFSPDGRRVVVRAMRDSTELSVLPVGVGIPKRLPVSGLRVNRGRWLRDGNRLVLVAQRTVDDPWQLFLVAIDSGEATPVPGALVRPSQLEVSQDDRFAAALDLDGTLTVYPLDGGPSIPLPELGKLSAPSGWTVDGQLWANDCMTAGHDAPTRLMRYDIRSRRILEERTLSPTDRAGFVGYEFIFITPDGRAIADEYTRILGYLYLVDGLIPALH